MKLLSVSDISYLIRDQFPEFYQEHGPGFITFIEAYYEWLQQPDNPIGSSRAIYNNFDIDRASQEFLSHFREKYMWNLPPELLGNQTLLQKHILELYRSKGSEQATRLLFRLLYNEDIEFYIPSYDIFKLSDNTWIQPQYIEVANCEDLKPYIGNYITGSQSDAVAMVESYEKRFISNNIVHLLFLSNITGKFIPKERILIDGIPLIESPIIVGSVIGLDVISSSGGSNIGDIFTANIGDKPISAIVSDTKTALGSLTFEVTQPGTYYTLDAVGYIIPPVSEDYLLPIANQQISADSYGFPKKPLANSGSIIKESLYLDGVDNTTPITGTGAAVKILSLKDTQQIQINNDILIGYVDVPLNGLYPFPNLPTANITTIISDAFSLQTITVGSIDKILVLNPGVNYNNPIEIQMIDPITSDLGILDANNNNIAGTNGIITGTPLSGSGLVSSVYIGSSGYNNAQYNEFTLVDENNRSLIAYPIIGGVGHDYGYYENTKSFLSNDKYLFDGHYYQNYSYVIQSSMTLDKYVEILKLIAHPAGNAVYGDIKIKVQNQLYNDAVIVRIKLKEEDELIFDYKDGKDYIFIFDDVDGDKYIGANI